MKQLTLIKQTPVIQLGHLYEHLFCMEVRSMFRAENLYPQLDYIPNGYMFYNGIVYIDLMLYSDAAIRVAEQVERLAIKLDEHSISTAVSQILAEKEHPFHGKGYHKIRKALEELHMQPWQKLDDVDVIDPIDVRRKSGVFYIDEYRRLRVRKLTTTVELNGDFALRHHHLLPLFRQLAWIIAASLQDDLADELGIYSHDDSFRSDKKQARLSNLFKIAPGHTIEPKDALSACVRSVSRLQAGDAFRRLAKELRAASHFHVPESSPSYRSLNDTGVLVGSKGWKRVSTDENCELVLSHMKVSARIGRTTESIDIKSILGL